MKEMRRENYYLRILLDDDKLILEKANDIREPQARAAGKVTLRESVFE